MFWVDDMAKILFTVCGVGLGHASRSSALIRELMKRHEVFVTSYGEAYHHLKREFKVASELRWFELVYNGSEFRKAETFFRNLPLLPIVAANNFMTGIKVVYNFKPDIVISDFDVNGIYLAKLFGIPVITISNMHVMNYIKRDHHIKEIFNILPEKLLLDSFSASDYFIITSFIKPRLNLPNTFFYFPIVKNSMVKQKQKSADFFLAYASPKEIAEKFANIFQSLENERFVVYGAGQEKINGNVELRSFSGERFDDDLAKCKGVLAHGGYSISAESLSMQKPLCVFSTKDFYERYFNGFLVQKLGFGELYDEPTKENVFWFTNHADDYRNAIVKAGYKPENKEVLAKIEEIIAKEAAKKKPLADMHLLLSKVRKYSSPHKFMELLKTKFRF